MDFGNWKQIDKGLFEIEEIDQSVSDTQGSTNSAFSEKWEVYSKENILEQQKGFKFQRERFLDLYGFRDEIELAEHLQNFDYILDAGCGLGYKTAWFASLAPKSLIIGIDSSTALYTAYSEYKNKFHNLIFAKGNIANTRLPPDSIALTVCDQVIMHTDSPRQTLNELSRITNKNGELWCYWYRKKALPRELLDEHFRANASKLSTDELWKLSSEVLELGRMLSDLKVEADFPSLPSLDIIGGRMDLQRFIYWNFLKCFWNADLGYQVSLSTNFDWYSPVNAKRFSRLEVEEDLKDSGLNTVFWHAEEACFSGRFSK